MRLRRLLSALALATLASLAVAQARDLPVVGGPGGGGFREACPPSKPILNGVAIHSGSWFDSIQPMCVDRTDDAGLDFNLPAANVGPVHGGPGGGFVRGGCEKDRYMVGLRVGITSQRFVNFIEVTCRNADGQDKTFCLQTGEGCGQPSQVSICNPGEAGSGLVGRSGTYLDAVGMMCERAPRPIKKTTGTGGPVTLADAALCKTYADGVADAKRRTCDFLAKRPSFEEMVGKCATMPVNLVTVFNNQLKAAAATCTAGGGTGGGGTAGVNRLTAAERSEILNGHNAKRGLHGVGGLAWSTTLADNAQRWVDGCHVKNGGFCHQSSQFGCGTDASYGYGENLTWGNPDRTGSQAVEGWYCERTSAPYDFDNPRLDVDGAVKGCKPEENPGHVNGHFTQVVWKGSTRLGCAKNRCPLNGTTYTLWACEYDPPGNFNAGNPGVLAQNVPKPVKAGFAPANAKTTSVKSDVDLYDTPGGGGKKVGILKKGQNVAFVSCKPDNWCQVAGGWVWGDFISK